MVFSRAKPAKKPPELYNRSPLAGLDERKKTFQWPCWDGASLVNLGIDVLPSQCYRFIETSKLKSSGVAAQFIAPVNHLFGIGAMNCAATLREIVEAVCQSGVYNVRISCTL